MADILISVLPEVSEESEGAVLVVAGNDPFFSLPRIINDSPTAREDERRAAAANPAKINTKGN